MNNISLEQYIRENNLTYQIETYGCQMNVHDSEKLAGILEELGYARCEDGEPDCNTIQYMLRARQRRKTCIRQCRRAEAPLRQKQIACRRRMRLYDAAGGSRQKAVRHFPLCQNSIWYRRYAPSARNALHHADIEKTQYGSGAGANDNRRRSDPPFFPASRQRQHHAGLQ